jgi:hypothetical protein
MSSVNLSIFDNFALYLKITGFSLRKKLNSKGYNGGWVDSNWVHSAVRPPIGLLCQPQVIMMSEKLVEWLAGETEVLGENLTQCRYIHHRPHMMPGREPGSPRLEASD